MQGRLCSRCGTELGRTRKAIAAVHAGLIWVELQGPQLRLPYRCNVYTLHCGPLDATRRCRCCVLFCTSSLRSHEAQIGLDASEQRPRHAANWCRIYGFHQTNLMTAHVLCRPIKTLRAHHNSLSSVALAATAADSRYLPQMQLARQLQVMIEVLVTTRVPLTLC